MEFKRLFRFISRFQRHRTVPRTKYCKRDYFRPYTNPEDKASTTKHSHKLNWISAISVIISITSLITIIYGFNAFDLNTKKLEELEKLRELTYYYNNSGIHESIIKFQDKYPYGWANEFDHTDHEIWDMKGGGNPSPFAFDQGPYIYPWSNLTYIDSITSVLYKIRELYTFMYDFDLINENSSFVYRDDLEILINYIEPYKTIIGWNYTSEEPLRYFSDRKRITCFEASPEVTELYNSFIKLHNISKEYLE